MLKITGKVANHISKIMLLGWMLLFMEACTQIVSTASSEVTSPTANPQATAIQGVGTQMNASETPSVFGPEKLIDLVKADLAQRLSVSPDQISVVVSESVEWSDSSLGCPQPDMAYLEVITPGYRILLEVNGQQYEYHFGRDTYFVYCDDPLPPAPPRN